MQALTPGKITPGTVFPSPLYHRSGKILIPAGQRINKLHLQTMQTLGIDAVFLPDEGEDIYPFLFECTFQKVDFSWLRNLKRIPDDLFDRSEGLIAKQDDTVTPNMLKQLETFIEGGLYMRRPADEMREDEAASFVNEFPFESPPDLSASAIMRLDASKAEIEEKREVAKPAAGQKAIRVLVAEDRDRMRAIMVKFLTDSGFEVAEAVDGKDALTKATGSRFDVLLLDVVMPRLDGNKVCQAMKAKSPDPPVVIMCTAKNSRADILTSMKSGADDYLVKPFSRQMLVDKIRHHLAAKGRG